MKKFFGNFKRSIYRRLSKNNSELLDELESSIHFLQDPFGDESHLQRSEQAMQFLLDNVEYAHSRLLDLLRTNLALNPIAIIEILPKFGRPESIPILKDILSKGEEVLSDEAASALALHPHQSAFFALVEGLSLPSAVSIIAAADGLLTRGNSDACPELLKHIHHENPNVRFHVIQTAVELDCMDKEKLMKIAEDDPDDDIKNLLKDFIAT